MKKLLILLIIMLFFGGCTNYKPQYLEPIIKDIKLYSLFNKDNVYGSFFLGSGRVGEITYLYFYVQKYDPIIKDVVTKRQRVIFNDDVSIIEKDGVEPTLRIVKKFQDTHCCHLGYGVSEQCCVTTSYYFYIPKNSIHNRYDIK